MLKIARELSESDSGVFAILEDACCESDGKPQRRHIGMQTEISCKDAPLATEVSILSHDQQNPSGSLDMMFWRAVATQRANELDSIREDITKMQELIAKNVSEKRALDKKHDELYSQLQEMLKNDKDADGES